MGHVQPADDSTTFSMPAFNSGSNTAHRSSQGARGSHPSRASAPNRSQERGRSRAGRVESIGELDLRRPSTTGGGSGVTEDPDKTASVYSLPRLNECNEKARDDGAADGGGVEKSLC